MSADLAAELGAELGSGLLSAREEGDGFVVRVGPEAARRTLELLKGRGFNLLVDLTAVDWSSAAPEAALGVVGKGSLGGASFVPPGAVGSPAPEATSATSISTRSENHQASPNSSSPESDAVRLGSADERAGADRFELVYRLASLELGTGLLGRRLSVKTRLAEGRPCPRSAMDLYPCADWFEREVWDMFGIPFADRPGIKRLLMYEEFQGHPLRKDYPIAKRQPLIGPAAGEPTRNPSFNHAYPTVTPDDE